MARTPAQIQADIVKAQAAVNTATAANVQAQATLVSAQAAAALATTSLKNAQAALDGFKAELAGLPPQFTPSPNGTTITPLTGSITDKLGQVWTIGKDGKEYRNAVAVPSSGGVLKMVVDGDGLKQWNGKDWWSQPLTWPAGGDGAGVVVPPPGGVVVVPPVVVPPVVAPPTSGAVPGGFTKRTFFDDFTGGYKTNWQTHFKFGGNDGSKASRGYDHSNQPWFAGDPDTYPELPNPFEYLPGGGIRLHTRKNPFGSNPKYTAYTVPGFYIAGVLVMKDALWKVNSYAEYDVVLSTDSGSFSSGWALGLQGDEVDFFEHLGIWADKSVAQSQNGAQDRLFFGAPDPKHQTSVAPTPFFQVGKDMKVKNSDGSDSATPQPISPIGGVRHTVGVLWTKDRLDWYVDRKWRGGAKNTGLVDPQGLIMNNVVGGWDGQEQVANIKDHTQVDFYSASIWS